jgi:hypothetical protein
MSANPNGRFLAHQEDGIVDNPRANGLARGAPASPAGVVSMTITCMNAAFPSASMFPGTRQRSAPLACAVADADTVRHGEIVNVISKKLDMPVEVGAIDAAGMKAPRSGGVVTFQAGANFTSHAWHLCNLGAQEEV